MTEHKWTIFKGTVDPHNEIDRLLSVEAPSWRQFTKSNQQVVPQEDAAYWEALQALASQRSRDLLRGESFRVQPTQSNVLNAINAALYLRRPLLITGKPGSGKTSLAYAIARELKLGPVLVWAVTARSNLQQGLYQYDAIARLQDAQLSQTNVSKPKPDATELKSAQSYRDIGQYIRLGPVGTAFIPSKRPRVLMIDEVDKSDINLPNDLLNLLEEGRYEIPELRRLAKQGNAIQPVESEDGLEVSIQGGQVQCLEFPVVIMTNNGEREFPSAFLRRCVRVQMPTPEKDALVNIVKAHLGDKLTEQFDAVIDEFVECSEQEDGNLATDQLLNTIYLLTQNADESAIKSLLFSTLSNLGAGQ